MNPISDFRLSPDIILSQDEHRQLVLLALSGTDMTADDSDWLLYELERARVVPDRSMPPDVVRMGSTVHYRTGGGETRVVTLVFPKLADIAAGKISILTPVGSALIGLRKGQSISYRARDGRPQSLTVVDVFHPETDDPGPAAA